MQSEPEEERKGGPRYLVAYCSIMTLLLAFFIILQAFASEQSTGLFYAGQGSFVRALKTFGLGGVFDRAGGAMFQGRPGSRFRAAEGQEDPSQLRRIDPELEEAQRALQAVEDLFETHEPDDAVGYRVRLSTPCTYGPDKAGLTPEERQFLRALAPQLERVLRARGFVIRVGADVLPQGAGGAEEMESALAAAGRVRAELAANMSPQARELALRRLYSVARARRPGSRTEAGTGQLQVDILFTKPYVRQEEDKGVESESENAA